MQKIDRLRTLTRQEIQKVRFVFAPTHPVLAALDYRSNDLFRYTFGSEDQLSNKILIAFLSDLLGIRIVRLQIRESEPVKANEGEKGIRFDLLVEIFDDQGREMVVNLEMQNYRMKGSLSLRSQAYLSRMVSSQIIAGENYEFCPVIQIMIVNRLPNMKKHSHFTHQSRYCVMEDHILMPDERCRILWVEMDYLNEMGKKPIEEWRMAEKILYMTRYSLDPEKQEVIQELKEKEEVIRMMEEKRMEFLRSTSMDIALMRTRFDEIDEQKIYEKGQRLGKKIGECIGRRQGEHRLFSKRAGFRRLLPGQRRIIWPPRSRRQTEDQRFRRPQNDIFRLRPCSFPLLPPFGRRFWQGQLHTERRPENAFLHSACNSPRRSRHRESARFSQFHTCQVRRKARPQGRHTPLSPKNGGAPCRIRLRLRSVRHLFSAAQD